MRRGQVMEPSSRENPWATRNPLDEARDLHRMVSYGSCTIESIRDLISVPPAIEATLLAYSERYPKDGRRIHVKRAGNLAVCMCRVKADEVRVLDCA